MIVERGSVRDVQDADDWLELPEHIVHWRGFVYLPGKRAGAESIAACDWSAGLAGACRAARELKGSYLLSVMERNGHRHYVFSDAGGNLNAFLAGGTAATSFLELCEVKGVGFADLDPHAVAELLDLGLVYERRTLVPSIRVLEPGRVYELLAGSEAREHDAALPRIAADPPEGLTVEGFFEGLSTSLRGLRVSADLTGGTDSRLIAALLAPDLDLEFAISGTAGNSDIEIAERVASALDRPLHVLHHRVEDLDADVGDLFDASDGLCDMLTFHRMRQNALARRARRVEVAITGGGGELYKDFWWLQDFPRYRSRRSDLERLFDMRFRAVALPDGLLAGEYASAASQTRDRVLEAMRERVMPLNTQTYDRIYYEMKMWSIPFASLVSRLIPCDAPLLDPELVRLGFAQRRSERFMNRFHRRVVTATAPDVARIGTTQGGMSLSAEPARQAADAFLYAANGVRRLTAKVRQRVGQSTLRQELPDNPSLIPAARACPAFGAAVARLRDRGVLAGSVDEAAIHDRYVGRVLTLGLLAERLEGVRERAAERQAAVTAR